MENDCFYDCEHCYLFFFLHVWQEVLGESLQSLLQLLDIVKLLIFTLKIQQLLVPEKVSKTL